MYKGCCCYCESSVEQNSFIQIEHFKPKHLYKELCYDYDNLHYCCERCNNSKWKLFDLKLINPSDENPEEYIRYNSFILEGLDSAERGYYTINLLKLNDRIPLRDNRAKYLNMLKKRQLEIIKLIEQMSNNVENLILLEAAIPQLKGLAEHLEELMKHGESYCTMVKHNFSDYVLYLKKAIEYFEGELRKNGDLKD